MSDNEITQNEALDLVGAGVLSKDELLALGLALDSRLDTLGIMRGQRPGEADYWDEQETALRSAAAKLGIQID